MQEIKKINLSLEFNLISSDKYCTYITDGTHGTHSNQVTGKYLLSAKDILDGKVHIKENSRIISENDFNKIHKNYKLENYDVLLTVAGTIGRTAIIRNYEDNYTFQRSVAIFKTNDKIKSLWLYYYLNSPIGKQIIKSLSKGTTQLILPLKDLRNLQIPVPIDSENQKSILSILVNIDKKIEINKRINKNLEDTILKIFDSWFVKFELSNEFSDSKLGLIPKGWKIDYLGSKKSCSIIRSGIDEFDNSKIYVATADVDNSIITSNDTLITMNDKPSRANMQPIAKSIWFAKMIDSRKLIMIDDYCSDLLNNYIFSTGFCGLKCVDKYFYYLWAFLLTDAFDVMKNNFCTGTTMQAINNKDTKLIEFVLPDDNIINQFNVIAKPMFKKIYYNSLEIKKLQKLRDTLLPKLMSGEIDVSKINCDLELKYNYMKYLFNQIHTHLSKSVV